MRTFMINEKGPQLSSKWLSGHSRAKRLKDKDLLKEFTWYGRTANKLAVLARRMDVSLRSPSQFPLPGRPKLPGLGDP